MIQIKKEIFCFIFKCIGESEVYRPDICNAICLIINFPVYFFGFLSLFCLFRFLHSISTSSDTGERDVIANKFVNSQEKVKD